MGYYSAKKKKIIIIIREKKEMVVKKNLLQASAVFRLVRVIRQRKGFFQTGSPISCHSLKQIHRLCVSGELLLAPGLWAPCRKAPYHDIYIPECQGGARDKKEAGEGSCMKLSPSE